MDLARAPRRAPLTARKKGSGYENGPREDACGREALGTRMVRSSNKQVFKSSIKSKQPQEILCKADVLLFWRKHSGLVFIANTIINTVELKVDF